MSKGGERPSGSGIFGCVDALRRRVAAREVLELLVAFHVTQRCTQPLWGCENELKQILEQLSRVSMVNNAKEMHDSSVASVLQHASARRGRDRISAAAHAIDARGRL